MQFYFAQEFYWCTDFTIADDSMFEKFMLGTELLFLKGV